MKIQQPRNEQLQLIQVTCHAASLLTQIIRLVLLRARCTNAELTAQLANGRSTLTARLTRCRVARSSVS